MAISTPTTIDPSVIASWPKPNYIDPETRGPALFYLCIFLGVQGTITVAFRIYSRVCITKAPGIDDLLTVLSLCLCLAMSVLVIIGNKKYFSGRHVWDIPVSTFSGHRKNIWISEWCYIMSSALIKISVLLFYRRLSVKFSKIFLIATWIGIIYNVLYLVAFGMALLLVCMPIEAYWMSFDPVWASTHIFRCNLEGSSLVASSGLSVFGDVYSTALPFILIWHLDLPRRQKLALYGLFSLGLLAVGAGIMRTVLLYRLFNDTFDFTWVLWETWVWAVVEIYVAIFAASAPALKPFFRKFFLESLASLKRSNRKSSPLSSAARDIKETWTSEKSRGPNAPDVERIGVAYSGNTEEVRERAFIRDMGQQGTRTYELRASQDGKRMIPMQVRRPSSEYSQAPRRLTHIGQLQRPDPTANSGWNDQWPISINSTTTPIDQRSEKSRSSQHTIHVGLEIPPEVPSYPFSQPVGKRRRSQTYKTGSVSGTRLASASDSDELRTYYQYSRDDRMSPWSAVGPSNGVSQKDSSESDETLQLPKMGSRRFDAEKQSVLRPGEKIGKAI